jgi:hypothetical protein
MEQAQSRFSDQLLLQFHTEFKQHKEQYEERMAHDDDRFEVLVQMQEDNAKQLKDTIAALDKLVQETRDIVQLHQDIKGVGRIANVICKLAAALAKLGFVGIALSAIISWLIKHYDHIEH